jgi:hypothetical protein
MLNTHKTTSRSNRIWLIATAAVFSVGTTSCAVTNDIATKAAAPETTITTTTTATTTVAGTEQPSTLPEPARHTEPDSPDTQTGPETEPDSSATEQTLPTKPQPRKGKPSLFEIQRTIQRFGHPARRTPKIPNPGRLIRIHSFTAFVKIFFSFFR